MELDPGEAKRLEFLRKVAREKAQRRYRANKQRGENCIKFLRRMCCCCCVGDKEKRGLEDEQAPAEEYQIPSPG